jgi:hypothetical protein
MTVAADLGRKESKSARLRRLAELIEPLVLAAGQLQLERDDVLAAVAAAMETTHD